MLACKTATHQQYFIIFFLFFFQMKDIIAIHNSKCPNSNSTVQVSLDGVAECRSNMNSLDVYSVRFTKCGQIYPLQIVRPIGKYRVDQQAYLDQFLTDVCINHCFIHSFVGDSQKRSTARAAKGHAAYFPCEYCEARGILLHNLDPSMKTRKANLLKQKASIVSKIEEANQNGNEDETQSLTSVLTSINDAIKSINTKHNKIVWPASTLNGEKKNYSKSACNYREN